MLAFNQIVFDSFVQGTTDVFTDTSFAELLGSVEALTIGGEIKGVVGSTPTFGIQYQNSADGARWFNQQTSPEYGPFPLSLGDIPLLSKTNVLTNPILSMVRLRLFFGDLTGGTPGGRVRLWVAGRNPTR